MQRYLCIRRIPPSLLNQSKMPHFTGHSSRQEPASPLSCVVCTLQEALLATPEAHSAVCAFQVKVTRHFIYSRRRCMTAAALSFCIYILVLYVCVCAQRGCERILEKCSWRGDSYARVQRPRGAADAAKSGFFIGWELLRHGTEIETGTQTRRRFLAVVQAGKSIFAVVSLVGEMTAMITWVLGNVGVFQ